jgi:DnaJ-class molecular chaperone
MSINIDEQLLSDDFEDFESDWELERGCPYCKGTGIDRHVEADCLTCYGYGYI